MNKLIVLLIMLLLFISGCKHSNGTYEVRTIYQNATYICNEYYPSYGLMAAHFSKCKTLDGYNDDSDFIQGQWKELGSEEK